jgi:hypothetical protein
MNFAKADVLIACNENGPSLKLDPIAQLDGRGVMAAIASNESSLGLNCGPRHEPAYDVGGFLAQGKGQRLLLQQFGQAAACSYGPWQMMFDNFTTEDPGVLETQLTVCALEFVDFFNSYVIGVRHAVSLNAVSLADIGEVWNRGHIAPDPAYTAKLQLAYDAWVAGTI